MKPMDKKCIDSDEDLAELEWATEFDELCDNMVRSDEKRKRTIELSKNTKKMKR